MTRSWIDDCRVPCDAPYSCLHLLNTSAMDAFVNSLTTFPGGPGGKRYLREKMKRKRAARVPARSIDVPTDMSSSCPSLSKHGSFIPDTKHHGTLSYITIRVSWCHQAALTGQLRCVHSKSEAAATEMSFAVRYTRTPGWRDRDHVIATA